MSFEFRDAVRSDVRLLILLAGGTGAGKTESAMRLATGLSGGEPFAVIDTENGRALHKADDYKFKYAALDEPFTPERYTEAVKTADGSGFPVIVIDSGSHEYEGIGGVLDLQAQEFERLGSRETVRMTSWIQPKQRHKRFVQQLLRSRAHVILNLRAEDKIEVVKVDNQTVVRPKESLTGAHGWIPICEKRLPFEATISLLFTADAPGVPKPIKLETRHRGLVPLDRQVDEGVGRALAQWAAGEAATGSEREPERGSSGDGPSIPPATDSAAPTGEQPSRSEKPVTVASEVQRRMLINAAERNGLDGGQARRVLMEVAGVKSLADLPAARVDDVFQALRAAAKANA